MYTVVTIVERVDGPSAFLAPLSSSSQFRFKQAGDVAGLAVFLVPQDRLDLLLVDNGMRMFSTARRVKEICCNICDPTALRLFHVLFRHGVTIF